MTNEQEKKIFSEVSKLIATLIMSPTLGLYIGGSIIDRGEWNPLKLPKLLNEHNKEILYRNKVTNYFDVNMDGVLSKSEQFKMDSYMGILDKPETYAPTYEDWQKAFEKVKQDYEKQIK